MDEINDQIKKWQDKNVKDQQSANELIPLLIGKNIEEAKILIEEKELEYRITKINGKSCVITHDLKPGRLNIAIEKELITFIDLG